MNTRNSLVSPLPSSVLDALRRARKLISSPNGWTQKAFARDAIGEQCDSSSPGAVRWCMMGAVRKVLPYEACESSRFHDKVKDGAMALLYESIEMTSGKHNTIQHFNDISTHKDVLLAFDVAIQLAGGGER